jgi:hypothetical protein
MTPLFKKLNLTSQKTVHVLNAPPEFQPAMEALQGVKVVEKLTPNQPVVFALAFATKQAEVDAMSLPLTRAAQGDAILWMAYPKASSKRLTCEFNRDTGWAVLGAAGFEPVRQVAVDDDWSALRFRRVEHIKSLTRKASMALSTEGKRRTKAT